MIVFFRKDSLDYTLKKYAAHSVSVECLYRLRRFFFDTPFT